MLEMAYDMTDSRKSSTDLCGKVLYGHRKLAFILVWLFFNCGCLGSLAAQETPQQPKFVICYRPSVSWKKLEPYDIIVVDYAYPRQSVAALRQRGKTVFGYLSLGKVQKQRPFLSGVREAGIALEQDLDYSDSFQIDAADHKWHALVTDSIIPDMKLNGFNGIFLDDLDDLKIRNFQEQCVSLIARIRKFNPDLKLMANRGLEYAEAFAPSVDYLLLESCFLQNGNKRPPADSEWALQLLSVAKTANPKLRGVAIDYIARKKLALTPDQKRLVQEARALHKKYGLLSCVSSEDLQSVLSHFDF